MKYIKCVLIINSRLGDVDCRTKGQLISLIKLKDYCFYILNEREILRTNNKAIENSLSLISNSDDDSSRIQPLLGLLQQERYSAAVNQGLQGVLH